MIAKACLRQGSFVQGNRGIATTGGRSAAAQRRSHICISKDERAPHAARVSASQAILDRAYGKAPTLNTSDPTVMKRAIDMSDDELAAIASGAKLTLVKSDT